MNATKYLKTTWSVIAIYSIVALSCTKDENTLRDSFVKFYGNGLTDNGNDIIRSSDNGFILVGSVGTETKGTDLVIIKTDGNGIQKWKKTYGGNRNDVGNSIISLSDGNYIVAGNYTDSANVSNVYLIKFKLNGDTLWTKIISDYSYIEANQVIETTDGGLLIAGAAKSDIDSISKDAMVMCTDANGIVKWKKKHGGLGTDVANSVTEINDGYVISGTTQSPPLKGSSDIFIVKTNKTTGSAVNTVNFGNTGASVGNMIKKLADGNLLLIGNYTSNIDSGTNILLLKFNMDGEYKQLSAKTYGTIRNDGGKSFSINTDESISFTGTISQTDGTTDAYIIKIDTNGNEIFRTLFEASGSQVGNKIISGYNNGYIIVGTNEYSGNSAIMIIKTDEQGTL
jgi:hypothetical protein